MLLVRVHPYVSHNEITPLAGIFNQLSVVFGILATQVFGFMFSQPSSGSWRTVFLISFGLAILQLIWGLKTIESPAWLNAHNHKSEAKAVGSALWKGQSVRLEDEAEEALLRAESSGSPEAVQPPASIEQCFKNQDLRKPLMIVSLAMLAQQVSGASPCDLFLLLFLVERFQE